jgi:hypothetical protein
MSVSYKTFLLFAASFASEAYQDEKNLAHCGANMFLAGKNNERKSVYAKN